MATAKQKKESTEVATKESAAVQSYSYDEDSGSGFEDTKGSDLSVPFINLLQSNSPDVQNSQDGSIRIGMMKNSVTGEIFDGQKGFNFIPVHKEEAFVEWIPRKQGGGFVALHSPESEEVLEAIKINGGRIPKKDAAGDKIPLKIGSNELVETYYMYGLLLDEAGEETVGFAVIAFTSTKIKPYRDFLTSMFLIKGKPPIYANRVKITSHTTKNESGTFANYTIQPLLENNWAKSLINPASALYQEAKDFREMVVNGLARANFSEQEPDAAGAASAGNKRTDDDDTPF